MVQGRILDRTTQAGRCRAGFSGKGLGFTEGPGGSDDSGQREENVVWQGESMNAKGVCSREDNGATLLLTGAMPCGEVKVIIQRSNVSRLRAFPHQYGLLSAHDRYPLMMLL